MKILNKIFFLKTLFSSIKYFKCLNDEKRGGEKEKDVERGGTFVLQVR